MPVKRITNIVQKIEASVDLGEMPASKRLATVRVQRKSDGATMRVNESDFAHDKQFSPRDYIMLAEIDPDEGIDAAPVVEPPKHDSLYSPDDLATLPIKKLRELPEFARIVEADRKKLRSKQDYVDAVLAQRRDAPKPKRAKLD